MSEIVHVNELRGKQDETRKRNREDMEIRQAELEKLNTRREDAEKAKDWAALVRLVWDYRAIHFHALAHQIYKELPEAYKVLATELS